MTDTRLELGGLHHLWAAHLAEGGVAHSSVERAGRAALAFEDPEHPAV